MGRAFRGFLRFYVNMCVRAALSPQALSSTLATLKLLIALDLFVSLSSYSDNLDERISNVLF